MFTPMISQDADPGSDEVLMTFKMAGQPACVFVNWLAVRP